MINHIRAMLLFAAIISVIVGVFLLALYFPVGLLVVLLILIVVLLLKLAVFLYDLCLLIVRK
jgi:hypothetical protein